MIIERLYQGRGIPAGTDPNKVQQVQALLEKRLTAKLREQYNWLAVCTKAVEAGSWGGNRRWKARRKLADLIDECRVYRGEKPLQRPDGWARVGLRYGYGACHRDDVMTRFGGIEGLIGFMMYFRHATGMDNVPHTYRL
jgi:hypothetical protein